MSRSFGYESMGVSWKIIVWDQISDQALEGLQSDIIKRSSLFDDTYSRFKSHSLISKLASQTGKFSVPVQLVEMLDWYLKFYDLSQGKINPLIGNTLSDLGYDASYSLKPKENIRSVPALPEVVEIIDVETIQLNQPTLIDVGCLGKGYFVDYLYDHLISLGFEYFLIDGSGDIRLRVSEPVNIGLEHSFDDTQAIGVVPMTSGSMASSGTNRRQWLDHHHLIDPYLSAPTFGLVSSWVITEKAVVADALATALFLCPPENFSEFDFSYLLLREDMKSVVSGDFVGRLFKPEPRP